MIFSDSPSQKALERMMTQVKGFPPRGSGVMVLRRFEYTAEMCDCRLCLYYNRKKKCTVSQCPCIEERIVAGAADRSEVMAETMKNIHNAAFHRRLNQFINESEELHMNFRNEKHRLAFVEAIRKLDKKNFALMSALYLLTAEHSYTVRELRPAAGYLENETVYAVTVDKDGDVVEITVVNDLIPEIGTTATINDEKEVCATEVFTLTDTVEYKHLVPGKEYTLKGILMDKATGEPFLQNGEQITSEVTFVPEAPSGSVEVLFTFDAKRIKTDTSIVVFESLYSDSKELTVHADIEDEAQTVTVIVPEIKTEASTDGKKETTIGGEITIEDIVSYHNLTPGKEYVVKGTLMNKTTGKPVTVNDEPVTAETAFTPEARDGEVKVTFTFNSYVITETTDVVVFESLYREEIEIAVHADIEDEGQSVKVYVPEIKTTASINGKKEITTAGKVTIEDVVSYTNLIPGTEYTIRGTLMNKATGEVFTVNGETITAEVKFTPESRNGEVKVTFTFDAHDFTTSTKLVVFESLYREDVEITTHKDIEDKDQTVTITPPPDVPQTGDNSNLGVWIGLGGIALGGAIACVIMYFKKKDDGEK